MKRSIHKITGVILAAITAVGTFTALAVPQINFEVDTGSEAGSDASKAEIYSSFDFEAVESSAEYLFSEAEAKQAETLYQAASDSEASDGRVSLYADPFLGSGTKDDPYLISSANDLRRLSSFVNAGYQNYPSSYYQLTGDIDFGGSEWTPIGHYTDEERYKFSFSGVFDGNGYTISNYKITGSGRYLGLFGLVYNGSVKNLTVSDFIIDADCSSWVYVGGLVGRFISIKDGNSGVLENCHVANGSITVNTVYRSAYVGGLVGFFHASEGAKLTLSGCSADTVISAALSGYDSSPDPIVLTAGGLIGYVGVVNNGTMDISTSYSIGSLNTLSHIDRGSNKDNLKSGGFIGFAGLETESTLRIADSFSTVSLDTESYGENYAGGFLGYLVSTSSHAVIQNCYSNANIYGIGLKYSSYLAGFISIAGAQGTNTSLSVSDCYTLSNVIDIGSAESECGKFAAYTGNVSLDSCYTSDQVLLICTSPYDLKTDIPADDMNVLSAYDGFDTDIWQIGDAPYTYPTLRALPHQLQELSVSFYSPDAPYTTKSGYMFADSPIPPEELPESHYIFSHWSLTPYGEAVDLSELRLIGDTRLYANFTDEYRSYTLTFTTEGDLIQTLTLKYAEPIVFPKAPDKPADQMFRYVFSHWSLTPDGPNDSLGATVTGDADYYAVYTKIETGVWDGSSTQPFEAGNGTKEAPYEIRNGAQLRYLAEGAKTSPELSYAYYKLTRDIDLGGFEWLPIGTAEAPFAGTFDGAGYSVYDFKITNPDLSYIGLFGSVKNASLSRLDVSDFRYEVTAPTGAERYAGGLVGYALSTGKGNTTVISECSVQGNLVLSADIAYAGGIVGALDAEQESFSYIENCYARYDIAANSAELSMAGGIAGSFRVASLGISGIDRCYYVGNVSAHSDVASYAGGIAGFLYDDEPYIEGGVRLLAAQNGTVRNSFAAGSAVSVGSPHSCYAGQIYAYKNIHATVSECAAHAGMKVTGSTLAENTGIRLEEAIETFYDSDYLTAMGFDVEGIWLVRSDDFPTFRFFNTDKNVYRVLDCRFDADKGTLTASFLISYRDVPHYTVLAGAYDGRGKMIGYKAILIDHPSELQNVNITLDGIQNAVSCTVALVDSSTLAFLETPLHWQ